MRRPRYQIEHTAGGNLLLKDHGPWTHRLTITNGAETVIEELYHYKILDETLRVYYMDSMHELGELLHKNGAFTGFGSVKHVT